MNIAIFGATGKTGQFLVSQALAAGHTLKILVRDPAKVTQQDEKLTVIQGDVTDKVTVDTVISGSEAVLDALGITKTSSKDILTVGRTNIIHAMKEQGVRRLVSLTGAGVKDSEDPASIGATIMVSLLKLLAPAVLRDSENSVNVIRASELDWVVVRGPQLTMGAHTGTYRTGSLPLGPGAKISRADVADFMLKQVVEDKNLHKLPMISY